ncbi:MAG: hypothetical protein P8106_03965 [Gammaproteobacteria bacterium]|jgi:hypothetical protein
MNPTVREASQSVQHNCHVADARHGGEYGMCAYLMKMREYFRWEKGLAFDVRLPSAEVGDWLTQREALWEGLAGADFEEVVVDGVKFDPFDTEGVNAALEPHHLVYSAGLVHGARPHFFLGRLVHKEEPDDGFALRVADAELARGLSAPPAMTRGRTIFLRRESLRRYLWEKLESWRWNRPDNAFGRAVACYPFGRELHQALEAMTEAELASAREHEIGEFLAGELLGEAWNEMLLDLAGTPAELMARAVRDHLADCTRTLPMLIAREKTASIHFFAGNLNAMRREIFPGLHKAYEEWLQERDLEPLSAIARLGAEHWAALAKALVEVHARRGAAAAGPIAELVAVNHL